MTSIASSTEPPGRSYREAGSDTVTFVVSDHGFGPGPERVVHVNHWLARSGWLARHRSWRLRRRLIKQLPRRYKQRWKTVENLLVNFGASAAWCEVMETRSAGVWLNVRGRQPRGWIAPGVEYERRRDELVRSLSALEEDGQPLFVRIARHALAGRIGLGDAYAMESAEALARGLLATLVATAGVQNIAAAGAVAALACAAATFSWRGTPAHVGAAVLGGAVAIETLALCPKLDRATTAWNHPRLVAMRDTPYGRVTVTADAGQVTVFENDALAYESENTDGFVYTLDCNGGDYQNWQRQGETSGECRNRALSVRSWE